MQEGQGDSGNQPPEHTGAWSALPAGDASHEPGTSPQGHDQSAQPRDGAAPAIPEHATGAGPSFAAAPGGSEGSPDQAAGQPGVDGRAGDDAAAAWAPTGTGPDQSGTQPLWSAGASGYGQPGAPQFGSPQPGAPQFGAPQFGAPQPGSQQPGGPQRGSEQPGGPPLPAQWAHPAPGQSAWQPPGAPGWGSGPGGQQWAAPPGGQPPWGPPGYPPPGGYGQPPRSKRLSRALILLVVVVLAAGAGAVGATLALNQPTNSQSAGVSPQDVPFPNAHGPSGNANTSSVNVQAVADKVEPGVVDITSRLHFSGQVFEGTGIVLSSTGLVLTNNHVVAGSTHLTATLVTSGRSYTATVVGTDAKQDVALLKLQGASSMRTVQVGDSSKVTLGTPVVAIGNAGGQGGSPTVTSGVITALNRTITASDAGSRTSETLHGMLQTNASIAEGDSGGPLSNAAGQVIGMDTAANTQNLGGPGTAQGFAIPINRALSIARQMAAGHGNADIRIGLPAFMGVAVAQVPNGSSGTPREQLLQLEQAAAQFGGGTDTTRVCLPNDVGNPVPSQIAPTSSGTLIGGVFCGQPAAAAGMRGGDVIIAVNGQTVTAPLSLTRILARYHPGETISVTWIDLGGKQHTSSLRLVAGPAK